jgi:hypothetical protein
VRFLLVLLAVPTIACAANDGVRMEVISLEQQPTDGIGLPPPADYTPCFSGEARAYDTNGDGRPDKVKVSIQGKDRCYGEDSDHDGRIDTWDVLDENGKLTKRAHDSNGDGKVDQAWTFDPTRAGCATVALDADGDGRPDPGSPIDICRQLASPPSSSPAAPVVPVSAIPPPAAPH